MKREYELQDRILDSLRSDDIGLYEIFWEADDGSIYDTDLRISKNIRWEEARDILYKLISSDYLFLYNNNSINYNIDLERSKIIIFDKGNWVPFDLGKDIGYLISARRGGER